jgi:hypothetical protein
MRPLEIEHKGWRIRVIAQPVGRGWTALVEAWEPGAAEGTEPRLVPFSQQLPTEKAAQAAGRTAALRWLDRAGEKPAN